MKKEVLIVKIQFGRNLASWSSGPIDDVDIKLALNALSEEEVSKVRDRVPMDLLPRFDRIVKASYIA